MFQLAGHRALAALPGDEGATLRAGGAAGKMVGVEAEAADGGGGLVCATLDSRSEQQGETALTLFETDQGNGFGCHADLGGRCCGFTGLVGFGWYDKVRTRVAFRTEMGFVERVHEVLSGFKILGQIIDRLAIALHLVGGGGDRLALDGQSGALLRHRGAIGDHRQGHAAPANQDHREEAKCRQLRAARDAQEPDLAARS